MMSVQQGKDAIIVLWGGRRGTTRRQVASLGASFIVAMLIGAPKAGYAIEEVADV